MTNICPTPVRARAVEEALAGVPATRSAIGTAAALADEDTHPTSDASGSAEYRLHPAEVLTVARSQPAAGAVD
jgi:carbon-monoxide dehydrogenase medium subunit